MAAVFLFIGLSVQAQEAPVAGQTFGEWRFDCRGVSETESRCGLTQTIVAGERQIRIAQFRLLPGVEPGVVLLSVQLPLGISIPAGVIASIDSGSDLSVPLLRCLRTGCIAARPLSGQELSSLRAGTAMSLRFVGAPSSEVTVPVSLVGLSDGLDATGWGR